MPQAVGRVGGNSKAVRRLAGVQDSQRGAFFPVWGVSAGPDRDHVREGLKETRHRTEGERRIDLIV
jgi:hypothetical protein